MPNDPDFEQILDELAEEFKLKKSVVRFVIMNYYRNVRDIIREGDLDDLTSLKAIYIPGFARLGIKSKRRVEYIRNIKKKNVQLFQGEESKDRTDSGRSDDS